MRKYFSVMICFVLFAQLYSYGQTDNVFTYQGVLYQQGKPADGSYSMMFSLYINSNDANAIWKEEHSVVVEKGLFQVLLGTHKKLPTDFSTIKYIGIAIDGQPEFTRTALSASPFAITADRARSSESLTSDAKGAVLSLNGQQGNIILKGDDGLEIREDNGVLTFGFSYNSDKSESVLNQGTEWLLSGNSNATASSWLGTSNNFPLVIRTNNTEKMRVLAAGNVGIGETNPTSRLTVARTLHLTNVGGAPELKLSAASGANSTILKTGSQSSNITYTLPTNDGDGGDILSTDGSGVLSWTESGWSANGNSFASSGKFIGTVNSQPFIIKTNNIERFRVTSGGALGINEDNPSQKLEISGNVLIKPDATNSGELRIQESNGGTGTNFTAFKSGNMPVNITYTLPTSAPQSNQVLTSSAQGILSWTTPSNGASGTAGGDLSGSYPDPQIATGVIVNDDISGTAAISYGKLALTGAIVDSDISNTAAISYGKLDLTGAIVDSDISGTAAISYSKLDLTGNIVNSDISGTAAISYSKLALTGAIVNSDISNTAAISYSKLDLSGNIVDSDISGTAAISYGKLDLSGNIIDSDISNTASISYSKLDLSGSIVDSDISNTASISYGKLSLTGAIVNSDVSNTAAISYNKLDLSGNIIDSDISNTASISYSKLDLSGNIVNSDISGTAAISYSKLDLSGNIIDSDISGTAAISYSKLDLSGNIVDSDISGTAAISYSKLNLNNSIVSGDIVNNAITTTKVVNNAINGSKIAMGSDATGDIMYYNGTDYVRHGIGTNGKVLTVVAGIPQWSAATGGGITLPYTDNVNSTSTLFDITNSGTGRAFSAKGGSTFINNNVLIDNDNGSANEIRFMEASGNGGNYTAIKSGLLSANIEYTLPPDDGNSGEVLSSNGSGQLSWVQAVTTSSPVQLAYIAVNSGNTASANAAVVHVNDNAISSTASTLSLPTSGVNNGQVMLVSTADADGLTITYGTGLTFTVSNESVVRFVRVANSWKPEF